MTTPSVDRPVSEPMTTPRRYLHLFGDEMVPGFDHMPVYDGDGAVQELALKKIDREAGHYIGTVEITPQLVGPPHVRVIDMEPEAERRAEAIRRREADPYPAMLVVGRVPA